MWLGGGKRLGEEKGFGRKGLEEDKSGGREGAGGG